MRRDRRSSFVVSVLFASLIGGCDRQSNPVLPTNSPRPSAPSAPAPPPAATLSNLQVAGPAQVPPGGGASYTATATWSDGTTTDVTNEAQWTTTNEAVLAIAGPGRVTARTAGEADVQATFQGRTHGRWVGVVPAGRFILRVNVSDGLIPDAPIFDARVEAISGSGEALSATTNWNGGANLYGIPETAELRVSKNGYETVVQSVHVERQAVSVRVQLVPSVRRPVLSGLYRLTVSADTCVGGGALPQEATTRTYTAAIWEPGGKVRVQLSDANFHLKTCCFGEPGDAFSGLTQALDTRFTLIPYEPDWDWNAGVHPSVAERLTDGTVLTISGHAVVRPVAEGFAGLLDGVMAIYDSLPLSGPAGRQLASCQSPSHRFTLTR